MLQVERTTSEPDQGAGETFDFVGLYSFLLRNLTVIATGAAIGLVLGAIFLLTATPRYTSTGQLIIDTRKIQLFQQQSVLADGMVDTAMIDSQVQVLQSKNVALSVIRDLKLTQDPEFVGGVRSVLGSIVGAVGSIVTILTGGSGDDVSTEFLEYKAVGYLTKNFKVKQLGRSYVIEYAFTALNPQKAAQIANALAEAYIVDQLEAKYQATRRASVWMQERIKELRDQAQQAARAVEDFKQRNNIITFNTGQGNGTRLINEQQLQELNTQLTLTRAQTAEAKAKLDRVEDILRSGGDIGDATVADVLRNEVITRLRQQLLDANKREAEWSVRYGAGHQAVQKLQAEMVQLKRVIQEELKRIAETYKSDYEIAKVREDSIQASLNGVIRDAGATNQAQIALRDLESTAQTYQSLYDNFLQRYTEALQQQSFPITEARVITSAVRPYVKSYPQTLLVVAIGLVLGLLGGLAAAFLREQLDRVFRTISDVEHVLHVSCFGLLPLVRPGGSGGKGSSPGQPAGKLSLGNLSVGKLSTSMLASVLSGSAGEEAPAPGPAGSLAMLRYTLDAPFSRFSETLRSVKVAADLAEISRPIKVLGIVSAIPNEGKSTVAANLAQMIAHSGKKTLLIDADLRNPSLSRRLIGATSDATAHTAGTIEVLTGKAPLEQVLLADPATGLHILPTVVQERIANTNDILTSAAMRTLLDQLRGRYDFVILDLPPLGPVVDARAMAPMIDAFLMVIDWGRTKIDVVTEALQSSEAIRDRLLGAVLNKVNVKAMSKFETYKGSYYFNKYYSRYGYHD
jgi:succinoglycan biosynthesis transport protein ExoP